MRILSRLMSQFANSVVHEPADPPQRVTRWRKDPGGVMRSRQCASAKADPLAALLSEGSFVRYGERPEGEGWIEAGYAEGGEIHLPTEEEQQVKESLVNVTSGFMKRS
jgi:hypothetical protein